jgi:hypothetical protein
MGHLLVLYTQVGYFIMQACAERLASAPNVVKSISSDNGSRPSVDPTPVIDADPLERLHGLDLPVADWFEGAGNNYTELCAGLEQRRDKLLIDLAA